MSAAGCVVCGASVTVARFETTDADTGDFFHIDVCSDCGHGITRPQPAQISRYYPDRYYGGRHGLSERYCNARRSAWLRSVGSGGRLLDLGCGDGAFLRAAQERGFESVGVELGRAKEMAAQAGFRVFETSAQAAPSGPFKVVTAWHSLEHFPDPKAELETLHELLEPAGHLIIAVPDFGGIQSKLYRGAWLHLDAPRHLHHFTEASLSRLLDQSGFGVERTHHQELEYDVFGWIQSTENLLPARKNRSFEWARGRREGVSALNSLSSGLFIAAMAPTALLLTAASTLLGRGGTLIQIARRR